VNKPWQVFAFLVLNRAAPVSSSRLIAALWPEEDLADPGNVLKNTVYALRREFKGTKSTRESPVLFENGGYQCNPAIHFEIDAEDFEAKTRAAGGAADADRLALLNEAASLYKGELLPQLDGEVWVMPPALYYKQLFDECVTELCDHLYTQKSYNALLAAATGASRVDPLEEKHYLYIFRSLYAMEMYRAIIPAYNKAARIFSEELGVTPCEEIRGIYAAACEQVDSIEQDIMIIKDDLREVINGSGPVSGPLYCTYDVFKYLYQMVARSSERSGGSVIIVLLTLVGSSGGNLPVKTLSTMMNQIKTLILRGLLRKSDAVARYSKSQYIIMLSIDKAQSLEQVTARIRKRCQPLLAANNADSVFATTELEHIL
jgi:DNA-binding SARP family transcriptional activator